MAIGWLRSRVASAPPKIAFASRASASTKPMAPPGADVISARACDSTIGSLSTYTMRHSGAIDCATSWVAPTRGSPVPMSRICLMPASATKKRSARCWNARRAGAMAATTGAVAASVRAALRSASKLSWPPYR